MGPSVNRNPVPSCSASAPRSTSSRSTSLFTVTPIGSPLVDDASTSTRHKDTNPTVLTTVLDRLSLVTCCEMPPGEGRSRPRTNLLRSGPFVNETSIHVYEPTIDKGALPCDNSAHDDTSGRPGRFPRLSC